MFGGLVTWRIDRLDSWRRACRTAMLNKHTQQKACHEATWRHHSDHYIVQDSRPLAIFFLDCSSCCESKTTVHLEFRCLEAVLVLKAGRPANSLSKKFRKFGQSLGKLCCEHFFFNSCALVTIRYMHVLANELKNAPNIGLYNSNMDRVLMISAHIHKTCNQMKSNTNSDQNA